MSTADYVLWFGALVTVVVIGWMLISFLKWGEPNVVDWWIGLTGAGVLYICILAVILSPTYYLIIRT